MNAIIGLGKWMIIIPTLIFALFHFMSAEDLAVMAPGGVPMIYFTGLCLVLAAISMIIGRYDKLAATLLGVMLLLFIIPHAQMMADDPGQMSNILKNIAFAGGAFMYASAFAKDNSIIG